MDIADSHTHLIRSGFFGEYGRPASGGNDLDVFESLRRAHRIDAALVLGYEGDVDGDAHYRANNAYVAELAAAHRWVAALAHAAPWLAHVPEAPFVGVAVYLNSVADAQWFSRWAPEVGQHLAADEMIVSLNVTPETLAVAVDAIRALEGCQVLVSHLGQPGRYGEPPSDAELLPALAPLLSLADADHVGVKLSGLYDLTEPTHGYPHRPLAGLIERIADAFGCARLYWGSDFSPVLDHVSYVQAVHAVSDLPWSAGEREAIMGGNLRRILRRSTALPS
jgi:predicted TIM-barrel fold metal-dependent hydrolase